MGSWRASRACGRSSALARATLRVRIETGKVLRILSNDLDHRRKKSPRSTSGAGRSSFFRWIKQTLKIRHLLGRSENAVRIQLAVALIAFLLLRLAHAAQSAVSSLLSFARLARANLMHRKPIERLTEPEPAPIRCPNQFSLDLRSSQPDSRGLDPRIHFPAVSTGLRAPAKNPWAAKSPLRQG